MDLGDVESRLPPPWYSLSRMSRKYSTRDRMWCHGQESLPYRTGQGIRTWPVGTTRFLSPHSAWSQCWVDCFDSAGVARKLLVTPVQEVRQLDLIAAGQGGRSAVEVARIRAELGRLHQRSHQQRE